MKHRDIGYSLLSGKGLEIGGLHQPAKVPAHCHMEYWDAMTAEEAAKVFPELDPAGFTPIDRVIDLDGEDIAAAAPDAFDFVVLNHVIEHVANPIKVVEELFRMARPGGMVVISAPDRDYTFDKPRALTPFTHVWEEYLAATTTVDDEHFLDFLRAVHPETLDDPATRQAALEAVRRRREHAHVWDSASFRVFLGECRERLALDAWPLFECYGEDTTFEYFGVFRKSPGEPSRVAQLEADRVLQEQCARQLDLLRALKAGEQGLQAKDVHIRNIEEHNRQVSTAIGSVEAQRDDLAARLAASEATQVRLAEQLAEATARNRLLAQRCEELEVELAAIVNSRSWRITEPLRRLKAGGRDK